MIWLCDPGALSLFAPATRRHEQAIAPRRCHVAILARFNKMETLAYTHSGYELGLVLGPYSGRCLINHGGW